MKEKTTYLQQRSGSFRILVISVLLLLMLIPLMMVYNIVNERGQRQQTIITDIAATWGQYQTLNGPILIIPYVDHLINMDTVTDKNGETKTVTQDIFNDKTAIILPTALNINVNLREEARHRGIYTTQVYTADINLSGQFDYTSLINEQNQRRRYQWDKAQVLIGLSDTKAITQNSQLMWNDKQVALTPGTRLSSLIPTGFSAPLKALNLDELNSKHQFKLQLNVKGNQGFRFTPLGETTQAHITSTWPHPSFQGNILPNEYETSAEGFSAKWSIPHLARSYPQQWIMQDESYPLNELSAGVNLFEPVSLYSKTSRAVKYGVMFIVMTFLSLLIFEIVSRVRLHLLQYMVIGVALSVFYLLLLSLAEHILFFYAYLAASSVTVLIISLYALAFLQAKWHSLMIFSLLSSLYTVLYLLLQMEDYALLFGSALLLLVTATVMYVTRNLHQDKP
jgi:inner membrane protein